MRVADTSALYAFFVKDDAHHQKARSAFQQPGAILVPTEVLAELLNVLGQRIGSARAAEAGEYLWHHASTEIQPTDTAVLMDAWGEFEASHRKLSYPDCIVIAWCREHGAEPLAYDKDLLRALRA